MEKKKRKKREDDAARVKPFGLKPDVKPSLAIARTVFVAVVGQMHGKYVTSMNVADFQDMCKAVHELVGLTFDPKGDRGTLTCPNVGDIGGLMWSNDVTTYINTLAENVKRLLQKVYNHSGKHNAVETIKDCIGNADKIEARFRYPITPTLNNQLKTQEGDGPFMLLVILFISLYAPTFFQTHPLHMTIHMLFPALRKTRCKTATLTVNETLQLQFGGGEVDGFRRKFNCQILAQVDRLKPAQVEKLELNLQIMNTLLTPNETDWSLVARAVILMRYVYQDFSFIWDMSRPPALKKVNLDTSDAFE